MSLLAQRFGESRSTPNAEADRIAAASFNYLRRNRMSLMPLFQPEQVKKHLSPEALLELAEPAQPPWLWPAPMWRLLLEINRRLGVHAAESIRAFGVDSVFIDPVRRIR